jgi:hypothetical protein
MKNMTEGIEEEHEMIIGVSDFLWVFAMCCFLKRKTWKSFCKNWVNFSQNIVRLEDFYKQHISQLISKSNFPSGLWKITSKAGSFSTFRNSPHTRHRHRRWLVYR